MLRKINYIFNRRQKRNLTILFVLIFIGGFLELLGVSLIMPLVTVIMNPNIMESNKWARMVCRYLSISSQTTFVLIILLALIGVYIIKNLYLIMMYNFQYSFTYNNQRRLARQLMVCYMNQGYSFHLSRNTSELQHNITVDVNQFYLTVLNCIQLLSEVITCAFLIIYLMTKDWMTTIGVALVITIFILIFYGWFHKTVTRLGIRYREENAQVLKWIQQAFGGIKEIKVMNREQYFLDHYDSCYQKAAVMQKKQGLMQIIPKPILESISICSLLMVLVVQIILGTDVSQFIPVLSVFAIAAFRMLPAFNRITAHMSSIMFTKASVHAIYEDLKVVENLSHTASERNGNSKELQLKNCLSIKNVSFKYPNTECYVLDQINLEISAYKSVALIGPSGAGKTTFADVILGILQPEEGKITADETDVFEHLHSWHNILGYIPQFIYLMDDTIRNNVTFGLPEEKINEEQVWQALREAQLETFVKGLEQGLDTIIGEGGVRLSGGQRQRIGIARALYNNPQVLILDEATSALDNDTEAAVMEAIESLQGRKTLIIIAHRLSTIQNCDLIYEVNHGKVTLKKKEDVLKEE